jgi:hypothetical protein
VINLNESIIGNELIGIRKITYTDELYRNDKDYEVFLLGIMFWFFTDCGEWWFRIGRRNKWYIGYSPCQGIEYYNYITKKWKLW